MDLILADLSSITPQVREYIIEYLVRHPETQLCVSDPNNQTSKQEIVQKLQDMRVPFDLILTNVVAATIPTITFKTMMLVHLQSQPEYNVVLAVDTDQEALDMCKDAGVPFVYNPLTMGANT
jgi:hypothetical protein